MSNEREWHSVVVKVRSDLQEVRLSNKTNAIIMPTDAFMAVAAEIIAMKEAKEVNDKLSVRLSDELKAELKEALEDEVSEFPDWLQSVVNEKEQLDEKIDALEERLADSSAEEFIGGDSMMMYKQVRSMKKYSASMYDRIHRWSHTD